MKAIVIYENGGPEVLRYEEVPDPTPGAGEILIEQTAAGVNFADVMLRLDKYFIKPELPATPGFEGAGVVVAVGDGVDRFSVGQRVGYVMSIGSYAEMNVVPAAKAILLPDGVNDEVAGSSLLRGITAQYLLKSTYPVSEKNTILIHSAAGGVGSIMVQWAKHLGATVIGTVGSNDKYSYVEQLGCDFIINYTEKNFATEVLGYTDGKGVDVVYDAVGQSTFERNIECLRLRGYFVNYGASSGPLPALDAARLNSKSLFFNKSSLPHYLQTEEERDVRADEFLNLVSDSVITPDISNIYPLADAAKAHTDIAERKTTGSVALRI